MPRVNNKGQLPPQLTELHRQKLAAYEFDREYNQLSPQEQGVVFAILNTMADVPEIQHRQLFEREVSLLTRNKAGGLLNPFRTTCWFNALVNSYFKDVKHLLENQHTPGLRPEISKRRKELLEIIKLSEEVLPVNAQERYDFNKQLEKKILRFLENFISQSGAPISLKQHHCAAEGLRFLNPYLGLDLTGGISTAPNRQIPIKTLTTVRNYNHLQTATRVCGTKSQAVLPTKLEYTPTLTLPIAAGSSVQEILNRTFMQPERLDGTNAVKFPPKEAAESAFKTVFCTVEDGHRGPEVLTLSLLRFQPEELPDGRLSHTKDTTPITVNGEIAVEFYNPEGNYLLALETYNLVSVTEHYGETLDSGHYVTSYQFLDGVKVYNDEKVNMHLGSRLSDFHRASTNSTLLVYRKEKRLPIPPLLSHRYTLAIQEANGSLRQEVARRTHELSLPTIGGAVSFLFGFNE